MTRQSCSNTAIKMLLDSPDIFLEVVIGCKLNVYRIFSGTDEKYHCAEILSIRNKEYGMQGAQYYVHYEGFNKRLDEWVDFSRLSLETLELSKEARRRLSSLPDSVPGGGELKASFNLSLSGRRRGRASGSRSRLRSRGARRAYFLNHAALDEVREQKAAETPSLADNRDRVSGVQSEKHRTTGSMALSAVQVMRVRNISTVIIGKHELETWYFSPYPEEVGDSAILYICEFCLEFTNSIECFARHRDKCSIMHPPGSEIYRNNSISFYEIDGRRQKRYCRNLCLLSKLFLDHKTLYYDVDPFLFYVMTTNDDYGHHIIGYFSKEKQSADNFNVACILTLPQYQRLGYGRVLISFSYELSKIEKKAGSPEKPLSDLGLLSYRSYWLDVITEILCSSRIASVDEISKRTSIAAADVLYTLFAMDVIKYYRGKVIICLSKNILERRERLAQKHRIQIDPSKIVWTPPTYPQSNVQVA